MLNFILAPAVLIFLSFNVSAQTNTETQPEPKTPEKTIANQSFTLIYASSPWNKDSTKIDSAFLFLRDSKSKKIAKILLDETEPDSATFSGTFSLDFALDEDSRPEIYIPPQKLRSGQAGLDRFHRLLKEQRLNRKPVVLRTDASGKQLLDVYDTNDQAERAKKIYEEELKKRAQGKSLTKPVPNEAELEAAKLSDQATLMGKLATEAQQREIERIRLEQLARQRALKKAKEAQSLSQAEKARRVAQAKKLGEEAVVLYSQGKYPEAEKKFKQAVDMNPLDKSYYFSYAVTLYRNEKYNLALVALKLAPETPDSTFEKMYYAGLIHYRLDEYDQALSSFKGLRAAKHPELGSSGAFYEGLILYSQEQYEESKNAFEYVLDNSQDPALDREAESYIEKIITAINYQEMAKKKLFLDASVGLMYDSNVTLAPDNVASQGTSLKKGSPRALLTGGSQYRFMYTPEYEWSAKLNALYLYSSDVSVAEADAAVFTLASPWIKKGLIGKKGYSWNVTPGYELVLMDTTSTGQTPFMPIILQAPLVSTDITLVNSQEWFSTYGLEIRSDDIRSPVSDTDDNSDALKYTLRTTQSRFLDESKKKVIVGGLGLVMNEAQGKNAKYMRYQGSVTYLAPMKWDALWNVNLAVYQLEYPDNPNDRKDMNIVLGLGMQKPVKEWLMWGVMTSYTENSSNVAENDYSKYVIMTTASFNYSK